jgi:HK97 gp10 family phage protein
MPSYFSSAAKQGALISSRRAMSKDLASVQQDMQRQVRQIIKKLEELPEEIQSKAAKKALRPAANLIRDAAKSNAPVGGYNPYTSGEGGVSLKDSIKVFSLRKSKRALFVGPKMPKNVRTGKVKKGFPYYAHWVEFGTRHMVGKGYMRRAYDTKKTEALEKIKKGVKDIVQNWAQNNKV